MSHDSLAMHALTDAAALRAAGRCPSLPFRLVLADGQCLVVRSLLRVLPGKRIVGEAEYVGGRVLAKVFVATGSKRHWQRECAGIGALHKASLPTPDVLASSEMAGGGYVVLTRFYEDAESLADAWKRADNSQAGDVSAENVLSPALALVARMHQRGLMQDDLHLGNFLCVAGQLLIIDGDSVRASGSRLTAAQAAENLGLLLAQLPAVRDQGCKRFLDDYSRAGGIPGINADGLQVVIDRLRAQRLKEYLGKCARDCTLFAAEKSALRMSAIWRESLDALVPLLSDPDRALEAGVRLKSGRTCTVARVASVGGDLVLKRYNLKNFSHAFSRLWRPSRAWHSWRAGHMLDFLGIPTPKPLAVVEERIGPLRRRAFLVTEYCPGPNLLRHLSPDQIPGPVDAEKILGVLHTLYRLRITHGDLKATNLLWCNGRMVLIDLDAMVQHTSEVAFRRAWRRDRTRLLSNWPASTALSRWFDDNLP